jgi:Glycosyl transferases group 1
MASGPTAGEPEDLDLQAELDAERAATDYWRRLARQRTSEFAALRRRKAVRAALALERRLAPLRTPVSNAARRFRRRADRAALAAGAAVHRPGPSAEALAASVGRTPAPRPDRRGVTLIVVGGSRGSAPRPEIEHAGPVDVVTIDAHGEAVAAVRRAIEVSRQELVAVLLAGTAPVDATWLTRLAAAIGDGVVAAAPVLVHPIRPRAEATAHDGRIRSAGLTIAVDDDGAPIVRATDPGGVPDPAGPAVDADTAGAAAIVIDRAACEAAGGLPIGADLDVAMVELCARLRARGGRIAVVPAAVMVDHRPVHTRRDLVGPIDPAGRTWRDAIDRSGPALLRVARPLDGDRLRFVITVAAPSAKVAQQWGDWHLAEGLAGGLRRLGHETLVQTADRAEGLAGRSHDVHLALRGLQPVRRSPGQRHALWIISHPESIEDEELDGADLILVASPAFARHLESRTATPVAVLLQGTDHRRFSPQPVDPAHEHQVTVVAKTRDVMRPTVADALAVGLRPCIYGGGWRSLVDPALVVADHVDNDRLPVVYSSAGVVLNDHWRTMAAWGFVSNRLFDVLACGTPVISDPVPGIAALFDGAVAEYRDPAELRMLVDQILADPERASADADRGRQRILADHTLDRRAEQLVELLDRYAKTV